MNGWADSPRIEELRAAWLDTADLSTQQRDLRRIAEAALGRRAVHPDGRVLAGDWPKPEGSGRGRAARLLRGLLRGAQSLEAAL